mmetsp:Transcript_44267/g.44910  ORF Transcript_44267/g.44910 Transcript_44267/m.44910 type:complete len:228 (+) Transcript_44267:179-862(+)
MKFTKPTIIALTSATAPAVVSSWNMGGPCYVSLKQTVPTLYQSQASISNMLEKERVIAQSLFDMVDRRQQQQVSRYPSQPYELIDNTEKFELKVDVPGVKEEDIDIKLDDGKLTIQGQRGAMSDMSRFTSKFSKTFSLDPTVDVDKFTASLKNGVLSVSAPKDLAKLEENVRRIPITSVVDDITDEKMTTDEDNKKEIDDDEVKIPVDLPKATTDDDTLKLDAPASD